MSTSHPRVVRALSGRTGYGFALALFTSVLWGILPVALKVTSEQVDAITISWFRLMFAGLSLFVILSLKGQLGAYGKIRNKRSMFTLIVVATMLSVNYITFLIGLRLSTPETAQLVIQLGPALLVVGGMLMFKERFNRQQWVGMGLITAGFIMFFDKRIWDVLTGIDQYAAGILLVVIAAVTWAIYALAQKLLLSDLTSMQTLLPVYLFGAVVFTPFAHFDQLLNLDARHWVFLLFCSVNTVAAYGAFAEALNHWEASRISAVFAITPVITYVAVHVAASVGLDWVVPQDLGMLSILGALVAVVGSALTSLSSGPKPKGT